MLFLTSFLGCTEENHETHTITRTYSDTTSGDSSSDSATADRGTSKSPASDFLERETKAVGEYMMVVVLFLLFVFIWVIHSNSSEKVYKKELQKQIKKWEKEQQRIGDDAFNKWRRKQHQKQTEKLSLADVKELRSKLPGEEEDE